MHVFWTGGEGLDRRQTLVVGDGNVMCLVSRHWFLVPGAWGERGDGGGVEREGAERGSGSRMCNKRRDVWMDRYRG